MSSKRRVVITGLGCISPIGQNWKDLWDSLIQCKSGIKPIDRFDTNGLNCTIAAQVEGFNALDYLPRTEARRMDLFVQYACAAARIAVEDAGLSSPLKDADRCGVWIGSGIGGIETFEKQHQSYMKKGFNGISPFFIPMMIANMAAGQVAIQLGAKGPSGCTVTACASGTHSIGDAFRLLQLGQADLMIAGGTEASVTPMSIGGFCAIKALSTRNDAPEKACRPFDAERDGFVMGEGSGVVVLEDYEHALMRGAKIYGEVVGYGSSTDAHHIVQPDESGHGAALALQAALEDAGMLPDDIDYINTHGTGTPLNDRTETRAIKQVFGEHSQKLLLSSSKANTGHMLGAAGAIEFIISTLILMHDMVPPTLNLEHPDPDCDLNYVPGKACQAEIRSAMSDSLGFGGHNAALLLTKLVK